MEKWSVVRLKEELRRRGARVDGRKADLINRLESYERNDNFANDPVILPPSVMPDWPDGGFRQLQQAHHHLMPAILEGHVVGYFHYRVACDQQLNSDIQAVTKGKALVVAKHVQTCSCLTDGTSVYFTGIVRAMMKRKVLYSVRLKFSTSGELINSDCECPAGAGPHSTCKHVAAMAIMLQQFHETGTLQSHRSCTETLQTFHKPTKAYQGSPIKLENLPQKRSACHVSLDDPRPAKYRKMPGYNDYVRNTVTSYIASTGHDLAIRYIYPKADLKEAVHDHSYLARPFTEYWVDDSLKVTPEDAAAIEKSTRGQTLCSRWFLLRQYRLTASVFGDICHRTLRRSNSKLCANIYQPRCLTTPAVIHGRTHEADALKAFTAKTGLKVNKAGLFISIDHPYLGATPDGLVGSEHVVEVKCPYAGRNSRIVPGPAFPFLDMKDDKLVLKRTHKYFDQVQGQMALTKRPKAYFVVFTFVDIQIIEVPFDSCFWVGSMLPNLISFYEVHFRKYLAENM